MKSKPVRHFTRSLKSTYEVDDHFRQEMFCLKSIIRKMPGSVYWKDKNGIYLGCNDFVLEMAGTNDLNDIVGKTDFDLPWKKYAPEIRIIDQQVMETGLLLEIEEYPVLADGRQIIMLTRKTPLHDKEGNVVGIMGVSIDITEQKKLEAEVGKSKETQFYKIIDSVPVSIYWKDKNGSYLGCNKYMLRMAGLDNLSEIIGKRDDQLPWKDIAEKLSECDRQVIENGIVSEIEETPILANREKKNFLTTKAPLLDKQCDIVGLIGVSVDITERKKLEAELNAAKEKVEAANKAKTEFLENMRHDIRTPLAGIVGFAKIIAEESDNPAIKEYTNNLVSSSYALFNLLNEVLEAIKVDSGNIPFLKKKFNIEEKLNEAIQLNRANAKHKNLHLTFEHDSLIPSYVIGDAKRLHRVVLELITNAINFTHKGSVKLVTRLAKKTGQNLVIKIIVEDTGIGISPEDQETIYLKFKRLAPSYEGIYKGAGLGLAIVKQFIEDLQGEIYVESTVGIGTKFTCIIPFRKPLLEESQEISSLATSPSTQLHNILTEDRPKVTPSPLVQCSDARNRVLLVEDDSLAAKVAAVTLEKLGCQVQIASSGKMAVQMSHKQNYDLILMDIGLPEINGYEATRQIRFHELSKSTHVPIVALTAHLDSEHTQHSLQCGMNAVFTKPLLKEKAEEILESFLPHRKTSPDSSTINKKEIAPIPALPDKVIDFELAKQAIGGQDALYEMLGILLHNLQEEKRKLQFCYQASDWQSIATIIHKLRGGAAYCGTVRLQVICSHLETCISSKKDVSILERLYKQTLDEIAAVENAIKNDVTRQLPQ